MKKILIACMSLVLLGFAGSVLAAKDAKEIRHCGCVYNSIDDEASMIFHDVLVAGNSNGHKNHVVTEDDYDDLCFAGLDVDTPIYTPFKRTAADCEPTNDVDTNIAQCDGEEEFAPCGEEYIPDA